MSISATDLIEGRTCGPCISCCVFFTIAELGKPAGETCRNLMASGGCRCYQDRPNACRVFHCGWRSWDEVPDDWRPDRTGFVLGGKLAPGRYLAITADPATPYSWRGEAYLPTLQAWANRAGEIGSEVVIFIEKRVIILREEGERDLGIIAPDEVLISDGQGRIRKVPRAEI